MTDTATHECQRCSSSEWEWCDYRGCSKCFDRESLLDNLVVDHPDGHVGPNPETLIRDAFHRFHTENPHVYRHLVKLARRAKLRGANRIGIGMLFEVLRWQNILETGGDDFKLNNNYRSYYARRIMELEPDLFGIFELRKLHGPA